MGYLEYQVVSELACCTWEQATATRHVQRVLPDTCVDLIWNRESLTIAGPDSRFRLAALAPGTRLVGVRLRAGAAGAVLGLPASELLDSVANAADVLGPAESSRLSQALTDGADPHALLLRTVELRARSGADPLARAAVAALDRPGARVARVAEELGVSARQLQRRVGDAVGYGPKTLARVLRFRRLQALASAPLVDRALDAGYADQAHMTAEVTHLTGLSPVRFLKDRAPTAA